MTTPHRLPLRAVLLAATVIVGFAAFIPQARAASTSQQGAATATTSTEPLTLDQAIQHALTYNPQVAAAQQTVAATRQGVTIARTGLAPTLTVSGTGSFGTASATSTTSSGVSEVLSTPQGTGYASFVANVPLFDNGKTAAEVQSAIASVAVAEASLAETEQSIVLQTTTAFFNVLSAEKVTDERQAQLKDAQSLLAQTLAQVKAGTSPQSDVVQQQSQVAQAEVNLLSALATIATNKATLAALLGADVTAPVEVQAPPIPSTTVPVSPEVVIQRALANRPEIAYSRAQVQSAQASVQLARVDYGPQLSLSASSTYIPVSTSAYLNNYLSYGLNGTVSLPLYDAGKGQAEILQAQATLQSTQASLAAQQLSVHQDAYQAYLTAVQDAANVLATQVAAAAADQALQVARGQYRAGVGTIVAVTTAEATAAQADVNAVSAVYSYESALATLLHAQGLPIRMSALGDTQ